MKKTLAAINRILSEELQTTVYTKSVESGLKLPASFLFLDSITVIPLLKNKRIKRLNMRIVYLEENPDTFRLLRVADFLGDKLRMLDLKDGRYRRTMLFENNIVEGVEGKKDLEILVSYDVVFDEELDAEKVEELTQKFLLKM